MKERYYTDEPIQRFEDVIPPSFEVDEKVVEAQFTELMDEVRRESIEPEKPRPKKKVSTFQSKKDGAVKQDSKSIVKNKNKYKNMYLLFLIQTFKTKLDENGKEIFVDPTPEIKAISVEEHLTFKEVISDYEQFKNGVFIKDLFYPFHAKGEVIRVAELSKEEVLNLSKLVK